MPQIDVPLTRGRFGETSRPDAWWIQPLAVFIGLSIYLVYATWAALQGNHYHYGPYLSPFYSPLLFGAADGSGPAGWFGTGTPSWFPPFLPFSSAMLILWAPAGFRMTCYYYRGAYYKAFWADPLNCAVGEPRNVYRGEKKFPLIIQNIHRYFFYLAVLFLILLVKDVVEATQFENGFGVGVGTIVLAVNVVLLSLYTLGCHSFRHLVGGMKDILSGSPLRKKAYDCVGCLNQRHMRFAWFSLCSVGFSDLYVRLCSMGIWHDVRLF